MDKNNISCAELAKQMNEIFGYDIQGQMECFRAATKAKTGSQDIASINGFQAAIWHLDRIKSLVSKPL